MDSGNSASVQSSSGGDEDFDSSRGGESAAISSFFNPPPSFGSISGQNPQFLLRQNPNFFDDPIWSSTRPPPYSFPNFGTVNPPPPPPPSSSQFPLQSPAAAAPRADAKAAVPEQHSLSAAVKNPKKRTRASRRAPTTVLTTDTTNFRQMVQEFTGIPSSPFTGTSPYSRRLDLFSPAAAALRLGGGGGGGGGGPLDTLGPLYSLRPNFSPPRPSPAMLNSAMIDSIIPSTNILNPNLSSSAGASASDHLLTLPDLQLGGNPLMNSSTVAINDEDEMRRWKSGVTVGNHDHDGGVEENVATTDAFDHGAIDRSSHHHHHHRNQISGHNHQHQNQNQNLNRIVAGAGATAATGSSSTGTPQGTVPPWTFPQ
ncbi:uncharacterized protein LOC127248377 [Andrographis paniculata]|uniref:uncharacterized protein LOC127248377 n=1 Tax=Andrographis paniculata TaxID=175694 RepID=UPI0021E81C23|nr:uncharacterized protein LOC127248377 [Andrographis paniculata]